MGCVPSRVASTRTATTTTSSSDATTPLHDAVAATATQAAPTQAMPHAVTDAVAATTTLVADDDGRIEAAALSCYLAQSSAHCAIVLFGNVYDVSAYVARHPGGERVLRLHSGEECGDTFMRLHGPRACALTAQFYVGRLADTATGVRHKVPAALQPSRATATDTAFSTRNNRNDHHHDDAAPSTPRLQPTRVLRTTPSPTSERVVYLTFATPHPLSLVPGGYVVFYRHASAHTSATTTTTTAAPPRGRACALYDSDQASFSVCVRRRHRHARPGDDKDDDDGDEHHSRNDDDDDAVDLCRLRPGDEVCFAGPFAPRWSVVQWQHEEAAVQQQQQQHATSRVLLVGAGVGVAPLYAMARYVVRTLRMHVTLVCVHRGPLEVVLADELCALQRVACVTHNDDDDNNDDNDEKTTATLARRAAPTSLLTLVYVFTRCTTADEAKYVRRLSSSSSPQGVTHTFTGHLTTQMLRCSVASPARVAVLCGPHAFVQTALPCLVDAGVCAREHTHVL